MDRRPENDDKAKSESTGLTNGNIKGTNTAQTKENDMRDLAKDVVSLFVVTGFVLSLTIFIHTM